MKRFEQALNKTEKGMIIAIEVSAGSSRDVFPSGYNEWRHSIGCHIRQAPVEGRANKVVISLISSVLGIPRSKVSIISGSTSSRKKVLIEDMDEEVLISILGKELS